MRCPGYNSFSQNDILVITYNGYKTQQNQKKKKKKKKMALSGEAVEYTDCISAER